MFGTVTTERRFCLHHRIRFDGNVANIWHLVLTCIHYIYMRSTQLLHKHTHSFWQVLLETEARRRHRLEHIFPFLPKPALTQIANSHSVE